jgi:PiT family inorganic phosphate transporter
METIFDGSLGTLTLILLAGALLLALSFEFVNGFHDTANAVATVIYTHTLKPYPAVVWSGTWNFLGVLTSSGAVAFGIVALLPVELILNVGSGAGFAMVFALLLSAIIWNLGTWWLGLPASSSHTLIGAIVGVGLMNSYVQSTAKFGEGVNWGKVYDVGASLLISPIIGFVCAALLLILAKLVICDPALYTAPEGEAPPPLWIRGLLILTCTGVSFAHGSNDGQKGMGLIMLILIGIVPAAFALDLATEPVTVAQVARNSNAAAEVIAANGGAAEIGHPQAQAALSHYLTVGKIDDQTLPALHHEELRIGAALAAIKKLGDLSADDRKSLRSDIYLAAESLGKILKSDKSFKPEDKKVLTEARDGLRSITAFIPTWVKIAVAVALGLGTMIGWKRIVVTVGEKIGKAHLTYAQGASAELVAMFTIGAADVLGLPVSTTHVLSSGVAGTMFANHSGLQKETVRNLLLAWVLTLPVCVLLGAGLFAAGLFVTFQFFGAH